MTDLGFQFNIVLFYFYSAFPIVTANISMELYTSPMWTLIFCIYIFWQILYIVGAPVGKYSLHGSQGSDDNTRRADFPSLMYVTGEEISTRLPPDGSDSFTATFQHHPPMRRKWKRIRLHKGEEVGLPELCSAQSAFIKIYNGYLSWANIHSAQRFPAYIFMLIFFQTQCNFMARNCDF